MINKTYKKWGIIVFSCIILVLIIYLFRGNNIDENFTDNLDKYELAYDEIKSEYETLKSFDEPNYRSEGLVVDFKLDQNDLKNQKTPVLNDLFKTGLIKDVIFTNNGGVIFKLKTCSFEDCKEHNEGFSGPYVHYITKDNIEFINENWVRVDEEKTIKNWTYFIVWIRKG